MPYIGKSPSAGVRQRYQYTATAGQTTFSGTDLGNLTLPYTDNNFVDVFQNGVLLKGGGTDYTATSGTSVVLTTGASVSDVIEIIVYDVFSVGNFFNRTDSDSRYVNVDGDTMTGEFKANGGVVFNEDSADVDFRVEGNSLTHALFVDGETDNVMIGTSVAGRAQEGAERLTIADTGHSGMTIRSGTDNYGIIHFSDSEGGAGEYAGQIYYAHGGLGENLVFATQGSNRVKVTADVEIVDGNLKVASGHGIDFSATSDGSGTDSSSNFNDYEEGTFTPTLVSGATTGTPSYAAQYGHYTKVGRLVNFSLDFQLSGMTGASGHFKIEGLPYTASGNSRIYGGAFINYQAAFFNDDSDFSLHIGGSSASVDFYDFAGNALGGNNSYIYGINNRLILSGMYMTS